jgi:DNA-binding transcriptional MerR regulator
MPETVTRSDLPPIPGKRYFTIGEVSELCGVKPHVLRYWEQEFTQLSPVKRRGNRRYYQRHDVLMVRQIRNLLYEQGFTIGGARQRLGMMIETPPATATTTTTTEDSKRFLRQIRSELEEILKLLES